MFCCEYVPLEKLQYLKNIDLSKYDIDKDNHKIIKSYINQMIKTKGEHMFKYTQKNNNRFYAPDSIQNINHKIRGFLYEGTATDIDQTNSGPTILKMLCKKYEIDHINLNDYCINRNKYILKDGDIKMKIIKMMFSNKKSSKNKEFKHLEEEIKTIQKQLIQNDEMKEIYKDYVKSEEKNFEGKALNCVLFHYENLIIQQMKKFLMFQDHQIIALMFDGLLIKGNHYKNKELLADCEKFINTRFAGLDMKLNYKVHDKTIEMPKDFKFKEADLYTIQKDKLEQNICKIRMPPCYLHHKNNKINFLTYGELKEYCKGDYDKIIDDETNKKRDFVEMWAEDRNKIAYDEVIFNPKIEGCDNDYNFYNGFEHEYKEDYYKEDNIFFNLIKHVINNEDIYNYFLDWLAHIIQKPYKKTNSCIIFYSDTKGVGKDSIMEGIKNLFKSYYGQLNKIDDLERNFNAHLCNKFIIYGEEITSKAKNFNDKLKCSITRTSCNIEKKGIDPIQINDYSNYIFSTNNENCFKVEEGDRRMCFINCIEQMLIKSKIDPSEYYNFISKPENMSSIYSTLKNRQIKYKIGIEPPPMTQYKKDLLQENKPAYLQFLYKLDPLEFVGNEWTAGDLHEKCLKYSKENYLSCSFTFDKFNKIMKIILKDFFMRKTNKRLYIINDLNDFNKCLYEYDINYYKYVRQVDYLEIFNDNNEPMNNNPALDIIKK